MKIADVKKRFIKPNKYALLLSLILLAALIPRLVLFGMESMADNDTIDYGESGKSLVENGKFEIYGKPMLIYPPMYPLAIGIADHFSDNIAFSSRLVSLIFGMAIVLAAYFTAKKMFGKSAGIFAAFFVAADPLLIIYSQEARSESVYIFFIILAFFAYLKLSERYSNKWAVFLGLLMGCAYLTRPEGLLFLILPFFLVLFGMKKYSAKKRILSFAVILFSFILISMPYWNYLYRHTGEFSLTRKTDMNLKNSIIFKGTDYENISDDIALNYEKNIAYYDEKTNSIQPYGKISDSDIKEYFNIERKEFADMYLKSLSTEIYVLLIENGIGFILVLLVLSAIFLKSSGENKKNILLMAAICMLYFLILPFFHLENRYLLPVAVFLALIASFGYSVQSNFEIELFGIRLSGALFLKCIKAMALMLVLIQFLNATILLSLRTNENGYYWEYKLAGEFIKKDSAKGKDTIIMSRNKNIVSYYAGTEYKGVAVPYTSAYNVAQFAKANKVDYIVIDKRFLGIRENYEELTNIGSYAEGISLVFEDDSVYPVKIFKLLQSDTSNTK